MKPEHAITRLNEFARRQGAEGVARALRLFGVRGEQREPCSCPLAVYLRMRCPGHEFFVPGGDLIEHRPSGLVSYFPSRHGFGLAEKTDSHLDDFAGGFDAGRWPELQLPEPEDVN